MEDELVAYDLSEFFWELVKADPMGLSHKELKRNYLSGQYPELRAFMNEMIEEINQAERIYREVLQKMYDAENALDKANKYMGKVKARFPTTKELK